MNLSSASLRLCVRKPKIQRRETSEFHERRAILNSANWLYAQKTTKVLKAIADEECET